MTTASTFTLQRTGPLWAISRNFLQNVVTHAVKEQMANSTHDRCPENTQTGYKINLQDLLFTGSPCDRTSHLSIIRLPFTKPNTSWSASRVKTFRLAYFISNQTTRYMYMWNTKINLQRNISAGCAGSFSWSETYVRWEHTWMKVQRDNEDWGCLRSKRSVVVRHWQPSCYYGAQTLIQYLSMNNKFFVHIQNGNVQCKNHMAKYINLNFSKSI